MTSEFCFPLHFVIFPLRIITKSTDIFFGDLLFYMEEAETCPTFNRNKIKWIFLLSHDVTHQMSMCSSVSIDQSLLIRTEYLENGKLPYWIIKKMVERLLKESLEVVDVESPVLHYCLFSQLLNAKKKSPEFIFWLAWTLMPSDSFCKVNQQLSELFCHFLKGFSAHVIEFVIALF